MWIWWDDSDQSVKKSSVKSSGGIEMFSFKLTQVWHDLLNQEIRFLKISTRAETIHANKRMWHVNESRVRKIHDVATHFDQERIRD